MGINALKLIYGQKAAYGTRYFLKKITYILSFDIGDIINLIITQSFEPAPNKNHKNVSMRLT